MMSTSENKDAKENGSNKNAAASSVGEAKGQVENTKTGNTMMLTKSKGPTKTRITETYNILKESLMRTEDGAEHDSKFCPAFMNLLHDWHDMLPHVLNYREE